MIIYQVKARDSRGNTTILHEVPTRGEAEELALEEDMLNPMHYVFVDYESMEE